MLRIHPFKKIVRSTLSIKACVDNSSAILKCQLQKARLTTEVNLKESLSVLSDRSNRPVDWFLIDCIICG